jgi:hypothetical protein
MLAMNFAPSSFIMSITLCVIQLSGQAELACPPSYERERLVRLRFVSFFLVQLFFNNDQLSLLNIS